MGLYTRGLRGLTRVMAAGMSFDPPAPVGVEADAPEAAPTSPPTPHPHEAAGCATCNIHANLADAHEIVRGAARVCPQEGLAWDVVGGFGSAREKVREVVGGLQSFAQQGATAEAAELRRVLPELERRLEHVRDCADAQDLERRLDGAVALAFEGQRAIRRRREGLKGRATELARKVASGEMTRDAAVRELASMAAPGG